MFSIYVLFLLPSFIKPGYNAVKPRFIWCCWGGEHCEMWRRVSGAVRSGPASDTDVRCQCLGLCIVSNERLRQCGHCAPGGGGGHCEQCPLSWAQHSGDGLVTNKINQHQRYVCSVQCNRDLSCWTVPAVQCSMHSIVEGLMETP